MYDHREVVQWHMVARRATGAYTHGPSQGQSHSVIHRQTQGMPGRACMHVRTHTHPITRGREWLPISLTHAEHRNTQLSQKLLTWACCHILTDLPQVWQPSSSQVVFTVGGMNKGVMARYDVGHGEGSQLLKQVWGAASPLLQMVGPGLGGGGWKWR